MISFGSHEKFGEVTNNANIAASEMTGDSSSYGRLFGDAQDLSGHWKGWVAMKMELLVGRRSCRRGKTRSG